MTGPPAPTSATLRRLETRGEYEACVRLQREIWGEDFVDVVPATILMVSQRVGGVTAGAFDPDGQLLGFVFGISGIRDGQLAHWSDMLAVRPEVRRHGLGKRLKLFQRDLLLAEGIEVAYWSFDPLVARNACFNLNGLGAWPTEYVINMYGDTGSTLHRGLDTDRLIVEWRLGPSRDLQAIDTRSLPAAAESSPLIKPVSPDGTAAADLVLPDRPWIRIAIPPDLERVKAASAATAREWQRTVREAFGWYLSKGYTVVGFAGDEVADGPWYGLADPTMQGGHS